MSRGKILFAFMLALACAPVFSGVSVAGDAVPGGREEFRALVRKHDFAGVSVGQSLQQVFDTLLKQGYDDNSSGEYLYKGKLGYAVGCSMRDLYDAHDSGNPTPHRVTMCSPGAHIGTNTLVFGKVDSNGTRYELIVSFTCIADRNRDAALRNAYAYLIRGGVAMKSPMGQAYYAKLADERYGTVRSGRMPNDEAVSYEYGDNNGDVGNWTLFEVAPEDIRLTVTAEDRELFNETYDRLAKKLLSAEAARAATAPKPNF